MRERLRKFFRSELAQAGYLILGIKLFIFISAALAYVLFPSQYKGQDRISYLFTHIWYHWDAVHYIRISQIGYVPGPNQPIMINFMPLFPWMIRLATTVIGNTSLAALLLANAASFAGLLCFYKLAELEFGKKEAWFALVALCVFPSSFAFNAPYTEGPFLLFAVGAWLAAKKERWETAGFLGGCAALTRYMGVFLFPALALEFLLERRRSKKSWLPSAWLLLIPVGFSIYLVLNYQLYGNPFEFLKLQNTFFHRELSFPWTGIAIEIRSLAHFTPTDYNVVVVLFEFLAAVFFVAGAVWAFVSLRLPFAVFVAGAALISLTNSFLLGTPRYLLSAFPLFFLIGRAGRIRWLGMILVFISSALLSLFAGRFVKHLWAF